MPQTSNVQRAARPTRAMPALKQTLLALTALSFAAGAAHAEGSSVTLYGFIDLGLFHTNNAGANAQSLTTMGQAGGNYFPSMFGFTGSEDLGGGMKAGFNLQSSIDAANGTQSGNGLFDRYATVSLSGSAGSLELGRQIDLIFLQAFLNGVMPSHANSLAVNGLLAYGGGSTSAAAANQGSAIATVDSSRISNAMTYTTPSVSGFTGKLMYALGGVAGSQSANSLYSGVVTYSGAIDGNALNLSAGYESQNSPTGASNTFSETLLGAKYSIAGFDLAAQYIGYKSADSTVNANGYELGAAYHVAPSTTVGLNYEDVQDKANNLSPKVVTLKGKYELSKRTYLYGMLAGYNKAAAGTFLQGYATTLGSAGTSATNFALGVVHGF